MITSQREKAQMKLQVAANIQKNLLLQQNTTKLTKRVVDAQREKAQLILRFKIHEVAIDLFILIIDLLQF